MKLLKRWLAFFVVVVLLIGVAFNSRGPLIASQVDGTTEGAADPSAASTEDGQQIPEGGDPQSQVIQGTEPTEPTVPESTEGQEPVQDPTVSGTGNEEPKAEEPKADEEKKDETKEEVVHQDAVELKQDLTDENNNVICSVTANIPEGTFEANTSDVTMEVGYAAADTAEQIKALIEKNIAAENQLGEYFLYNVVFKVKGEQVEPGKEIKITFEPKDFKVKDTKKAVTFYYNEANSPVGNAAAEIVGITQKADKIEELQNAGQSIDTVDDDYDLSEISLREDGTAEKVMMEGRRSTIYGCYVEEKKPVLEYEDDDVKVHVSADKEGVIPEGASLQVVPIKKDETETQDQYKEVEQKIQEKASEEEYDIAGFLAYDITFIDKDGNKVEPNGEVKVSMEYKKAVLPEEVDEETVKEADVTVLHLEEDENGNVKDVVDLSNVTEDNKSNDKAENKIETIQTTETQKIEKAEFVTSSFSTYVITWNVSNYRDFKVNIRYVDSDGKSIPNEEVVNAQLNTAGRIDLEDYIKDIPGYRNPVIHQGSKTGKKISYLNLGKRGSWNTVYYISTDQTSEWLSSQGTKEGNIYIVYEALPEGITIEDNIVTDGSFTANYVGTKEVKSYTWYKSNSKNEGYKAVERVEYQGNVFNISEDGSKLYPAYDEGARKWYKLEVTFTDGTKKESDPLQVVYYNELQNGSFEDYTKGIAANSHAQISNSDYKPEGVWQTTGTDGKIEIINLTPGKPGYNTERGSYSWYTEDGAKDGNYFAEINCEAAGALYQDVLTYEGQPLNWWLSHRARGSYQTSTKEYDTMYLVIMPTSIALTAGDNGSELDKQSELEAYLKNLNIDIKTKYSNTGSEGLYNQDGIYVYRVTSDDQSWNSINKISDYTAAASATRFFFVAGATASNKNTVGNFLDEVGFGQKLPPVENDEFTLQIEKKFKGLDGENLSKVYDKIQFKISATNADGEELSEEEIIKIFGKSVITKKDMKENLDGSLIYSLPNQKINKETYKVTITELNADLEGYQLAASSKTSVTVDGEKKQETDDSIIQELKGKTTAKVTFINTYDIANYKNINFTKIWDDNDNAFNTRPESLDVTLKASIIVADGENSKRIELDGPEYTKTATLVAPEWKTSWKVPVYYNYNGVDVKIDYTVEEGTINSNYVYEAQNGGIAQEGTGESYQLSDFTDVTVKSEEEPAQIENRMFTNYALLAANSGAISAADNDGVSELGEPAHKKYIEYSRLHP